MNKLRLDLLWKGLAMGIAEAIPGVSGGTLAFITGIYQELLDTIKAFNPSNLKLLFRSPGLFFENINGGFLLLLLSGMGAGLGIGVLVISKLLLSHKEVLWAFFLGVVLMSIVHFSKAQRWNVKGILLAVIMACLTFWITTLEPTAGSNAYVYVFVAGAVAISALMLPGISGSFILLLFGLYDTIIMTVKNVLTERSFTSESMILVVFAAGMLVGLFSFARVLSYLFKQYYELTMAAMIGVLIGSLNKLWPWKKITSVLNKSTMSIESADAIYLVHPEEYKVIGEVNLLPFDYAIFGDPRIFMVALAILLGIVVVYGMSRFDVQKAKA